MGYELGFKGYGPTGTDNQDLGPYFSGHFRPHDTETRATLKMGDSNRTKDPLHWLKNWKQFKATVGGWMTTGSEYGLMGYMLSRQIGWYIVTTAMITALPLVFEYNREGIVEDLEALQVADAIDKGAAPQQLAQQGMTSAVGPKVLK